MMKNTITKNIKEKNGTTNIFEKEKKHIKFKLLLKILSKYNPNKIFRYKKNQVNKTST